MVHSFTLTQASIDLNGQRHRLIQTSRHGKSHHDILKGFRETLSENCCQGTFIPLNARRTRSLQLIQCSSLLLLNDPLRNYEDRNETTRRLFHFALEIISLLSGEDYTIVRKTPGDGVTPIIHLQESGGRSPGPITEPPPHSLLHERNKKILELSNKMIELLSGEVTAGTLYSTGGFWVMSGEVTAGILYSTGGFWVMSGEVTAGTLYRTGGFWVMSGEVTAGTLYRTGGFWVMSGEPILVQNKMAIEAGMELWHLQQ
ncbi:unnamed protein product [Ranitomeya imitator]|uniref:Uncharacterized protein n=1 Tax=Ranitomeya imitator TaxID=111125 RepID=A0ABN9LW03_9NEOB|nr:unnamed protein product [Ranitomeya imitator]